MITTDCCQGKRERQKKRNEKKDCTLFNTAISNIFNKSKKIYLYCESKNET